MLLRRDDYRFWSAQWRVHGSCSTLSQSPHLYFDPAEKIKKNKIKIDDILRKARIVPNNTQTYTTTLFNITVYNSIHTYPQFICEIKASGNHLLEVEVRLDINGKSFQNCIGPCSSCGTDKIGQCNVM